MATGQVVTNSGRLIALNRTFKDTPDYTAPTEFAVGTGTTTPAETDTDLDTAVIISGGNYRKAFLSGYPLFDEANLQVTIRALLTVSEANGNSLTEFGLFNTDGTNKLFSRIVHTAITKDNTVQVIYVEKLAIKQ